MENSSGEEADMTIDREMAALMGQWRERHESAGHRCFISDGAVDYGVWAVQSTPRVCWLLKEAYSGDGEPFDLAGAYLAGDSHTWRTWKRVACVTRAVHDAFAGEVGYDGESVDRGKQDLLRSVAIVNVKKSDGAKSSSSADLMRYESEDRDLLRKQLEILAPDVVVCGGTGWLMRRIWEGTRTPLAPIGAPGDTVYSWGSALVLSMHHPGQRNICASDDYYAAAGMCLSALARGIARRP